MLTHSASHRGRLKRARLALGKLFACSSLAESDHANCRPALPGSSSTASTQLACENPEEQKRRVTGADQDHPLLKRVTVEYTCSKEDMEKASKIFWALPELVESVVELLDIESTVKLVKAHPPTAGILQGPVWRKLTKTTCAAIKNLGGDCLSEHPDHELEASERKKMTGHLKELLCTKSQLAVLLDVIFELFPPAPAPDPPFDIFYFDYYDNNNEEFVRLSCPGRQNSHSVSLLGFLLIEEFDGTLGLAVEHKVEDVTFLSNNSSRLVLAALIARILQQEEKVNKLHFTEIIIEHINDAKNMISLLKKCKEVTLLSSMRVTGDIREEGWATVAAMTKLLSGYITVYSNRNFTIRGRIEDLRTVYDGLREEEDPEDPGGGFSFWCFEDPPGVGYGQEFGEWHLVEWFLDWKFDWESE